MLEKYTSGLVSKVAYYLQTPYTIYRVPAQLIQSLMLSFKERVTKTIQGNQLISAIIYSASIMFLGAALGFAMAVASSNLEIPYITLEPQCDLVELCNETDNSDEQISDKFHVEEISRLESKVEELNDRISLTQDIYGFQLFPNKAYILLGAEDSAESQYVLRENSPKLAYWLTNPGEEFYTVQILEQNANAFGIVGAFDISKNSLASPYDTALSPNGQHLAISIGAIATGCHSDESCSRWEKPLETLRTDYHGIWIFNFETKDFSRIQTETFIDGAGGPVFLNWVSETELEYEYDGEVIRENI